jgi:hypothetical protein
MLLLVKSYTPTSNLSGALVRSFQMSYSYKPSLGWAGCVWNAAHWFVSLSFFLFSFFYFLFGFLVFLI